MAFYETPRRNASDGSGASNRSTNRGHRREHSDPCPLPSPGLPHNCAKQQGLGKNSFCVCRTETFYAVSTKHIICGSTSVPLDFLGRQSRQCMIMYHEWLMSNDYCSRTLRPVIRFAGLNG
jgi:hypothetical protein